jgi:MtN3 and saliva related transmembrane protein
LSWLSSKHQEASEKLPQPHVSNDAGLVFFILAHMIFPMEELLGYLAGTLTTASFIPQAYKIIRHKNVDGVSLAMYVVFAIGVFVWLVYGLLTSNNPIILFNILTLSLSITIIYNLIRYKNDA